MNKWDMFSIEKDRNKSEILSYLNDLYREKNYDKLIRVIKISGIYISYDFRKIDEVQREKVTNFLNHTVKKDIPKRIDKLFYDISILKNIRGKVLKKAKENYEALPLEKQAYYLTLYINEYIALEIQKSYDVKANPSDVSDTNEVIISSFGIVLKDMMRKNLPFNISGKINDNDKPLIGKHLTVASELRAINNIIETWMFSDLEINFADNHHKFIIQEVGEFGKNKLMSQIPFLDVKAAKNSFINLMPIDDSNLILKMEKESLYNKITEYFYTKNFKQKYKGIPLDEWVTAYWCLYEISWRKVKSNNEVASVIYFSNSEWKNLLLNGGVSKSYVDILLKKLTLSTKGKDLYDCPLISFGDGLACLPYLILLIDISQSLMSQLGIDEDETKSRLNKKGKNFEIHIESLTKKQIKTFIPNLKRKENNTFYELDLIFLVEDNLFIIESKTQKQPGNHRDFYRNQEELREYIHKFNRNVNYFINNKIHKDYIMKRLGVNKVNNVYKLFVSNVYQSVNFLDGVYVIDEINYYNFMHRHAPVFHYFNPIEKNFTTVSYDSDLYTGEMTSSQFLSLINSKRSNDRLQKRIGIRRIDFNNQLNLFYSCYYIESGDHKRYDSSTSFFDILKDLHNKYF
jgi:hypothetical protein